MCCSKKIHIHNVFKEDSYPNVLQKKSHIHNVLKKVVQIHDVFKNKSYS